VLAWLGFYLRQNLKKKELFDEHYTKLKSILTVWASALCGLNFWLQSLFILLLALVLFGPIVNLLIWTVTETWYFPHSLPTQWGFKYWHQVFNPYSDVSSSLLTSLLIAVLTVLVCLLVSVPAGYALSKQSMPFRVFLDAVVFDSTGVSKSHCIHEHCPSFYDFGLNGTLLGVILVHSVHGLMFSIWISVAAFSSTDPMLERASRNLGAGPFIPSSISFSLKRLQSCGELHFLSS